MNTTTAFDPILFAFVLSVLIIGIIVSFALSYVSGWSSLAQVYASNSNGFIGNKFFFRSATFRGFIGYSNVLTVGISQSELFLALFFVFRLGHPPLAIPLDDVQGEETRIFFVNWVDLSFAQAPHVKIRIFKRLANRLEDGSSQSWSYRRLMPEQ